MLWALPGPMRLWIAFEWRWARHFSRALLGALWLCATAGCLTPHEVARVERNVVYGRVNETELTLDLFFPKSADLKPHPVAINVHGGAWTRGAKWNGPGWIAMPELLKRGYVFASINYRLAPRFKFPAPIEDAKCAVRFLRAHAARYHLDPNRIAALGGSAGGHIVGLLGTADASAGFDASGGWTNESSRVQAVVDMFGPSDLVYAAQHGRGVCGLAGEFLARNRRTTMFCAAPVP
jgi:acetyl esterase/lipase